MTPRQRSTYFGTLWPQACKAQGWNVKDENRRKCVTFGATGEESTSDLNEDQITLLFNKLRLLADPQNFDKALADADPAAALEENKRKQLIWRVEKAAAKVPGDAESWLSELSAGKCAAHGVREWRKLPTPELLRFSFTVASRTTEMARENRAFKATTKQAPKKARKKRPAHGMQDACTVYSRRPKPGLDDEEIPDMPF